MGIGGWSGLLGGALLVAAGGAARADAIDLNRSLVLRLGLAVPSGEVARDATAAGGIEYEFRPDHRTGSFSVSAHVIHLKAAGATEGDAFPITLNYRLWTPWWGALGGGARLFAGAGAGLSYLSTDVGSLGLSRGFTPVWGLFGGVEVRRGWQVEARVLARKRLSESVSGASVGYRF